jgi:putative hydrolase of the HAD superfamily
MSRGEREAIEAVLWDIGGVILDIESVREGHVAFVGWLVETYDLESVDDFVSTWRREIGEYFREREGTEFRPARDGYHRAIEVITGESLDQNDWLPRFREILSEHLRSNPGASETIGAIAETGRHQGILSDVDADEGRFILDQLGVLDHCDAITTSEEVGRTKPDRAMFEAALEKAAVDPGRALMMGDRYRHDMEGATALGIRTAAYGAEDGPAVDHRLTDFRDLLELLGIDE